MFHNAQASNSSSHAGNGMASLQQQQTQHTLLDTQQNQVPDRAGEAQIREVEQHCSPSNCQEGGIRSLQQHETQHILLIRQQSQVPDSRARGEGRQRMLLLTLKQPGRCQSKLQQPAHSQHNQHTASTASTQPAHSQHTKYTWLGIDHTNQTGTSPTRERSRELEKEGKAIHWFTGLYS